jgi:BirA family biotin operon repressor/biotin-[acetyl-CoA-carboxylase] ligase
MSLIVRRVDPLLPLRAAVALCDALEPLPAVAIKWPNDVWVSARKVAGILVEGRPQEGWAVLGMGVNVRTAPEQFPEELRDRATSVAAAGGPDSVDEVLTGLLHALEARLDEAPDRLLEAWRGLDALAGGHVAWDGGEGTAAGVDETGALLVDTAGGRVALDAGEVHLGQ